MPTRPGAMPARRLPPRNGQPLPPRQCVPSRDAFVTRHQQGFTRVRPSSLPLTCGHQTARRPLSFPLSFTPPGTRYPDACQGGDRSPALTRATCPASAEPPSRNHSQRATSRRNRSQNRTLLIPIHHSDGLGHTAAGAGEMLHPKALTLRAHGSGGDPLHICDLVKRVMTRPAGERVGSSTPCSFLHLRL